uniref:Uncharacterized protein n=1 Tax=Romanomermis culicivorax TaxID=13658 RepID=A0A915J3Q9_ROMCU
MEGEMANKYKEMGLIQINAYLVCILFYVTTHFSTQLDSPLAKFRRLKSKTQFEKQASALHGGRSVKKFPNIVPKYKKNTIIDTDVAICTPSYI